MRPRIFGPQSSNRPQMTPSRAPAKREKSIAQLYQESGRKGFSKVEEKTTFTITTKAAAVLETLRSELNKGKDIKEAARAARLTVERAEALLQENQVADV